MNRSVRQRAGLALAAVVIAIPTSGQATTYTCNGKAATIVGTPGDDVIEGTDGDDVIVGAGGRDRVYAGSGHDSVCVTWADGVSGEGGDDHLRSDDVGFGGYGGTGDDRIVGFSTANGGDGNDILRPGRDFDYHYVSYDGGPGDDLLIGSRALPIVEDEWDELFGGEGNDILRGRDGFDFLYPGPGANTVAGGDGIDRVIYDDSPVPVSIDLSMHEAVGLDERSRTIIRDTISGIENAEGSGLDDHIVGDGGSNSLDGCIGGDRVEGAGGNDKIGSGFCERDIYRSEVLSLHPEIVDGGEGYDHCAPVLYGFRRNCESGGLLPDP